MHTFTETSAYFLWVFFYSLASDIKNGRCVHFYMCVIKMELNAIFIGMFGVFSLSPVVDVVSIVIELGFHKGPNNDECFL